MQQRAAKQCNYHCVYKVERVLNHAGKAVKGSRITLFGVSCKPGVGDLRQSPALSAAM
jgi:UDP-N-acetyl-D-glucosamine dehydrogenase